MNKINKIFILLLLIYTIFSFSCSPQKRYNFLSSFLDDVPLPDSVKVINDSLFSLKKDSIPEIKETTAESDIIHPPAEEGGCKNCHDIGSSFKLIEKVPDLCNNCHDDFKRKNKKLHGPLNVGECSSCHDPHKSRNKKLLNLPGQDLCFYCHTKESVLKNDVHLTIDKTNCWECHNPHGGSDNYFMK